jgi:P4 family phage/plasmid primase-like protien
MDFTGRGAPWPDDAQLDQWVESMPRANVGLRLPDDVLGVDVDAYNGRVGAETVDWFETQLDEQLPPTWISTSRTDGSGSGIRLYRVPPGLDWKSDLGRGSNVEIVRHGHRFAVVWPSVHPDTQGTYRWYAPGWVLSESVPQVADLAFLGPRWVEALQVGGAGRDRSGAHSAEDNPALDDRGERVDVEGILRDGIAPGEQQTEFYRYMCSLRGRNAYRSEMIALGMVVLQLLVNSDPANPWTADDVIELVDRVRREHGPGRGIAGPSPTTLAWAQRVGLSATQVQEAPPRDALPTDLGNSLRVVRVLGDRLRFAADEKRWYVWDGLRWAPDRTNRSLDLTKEVIDSIRRDAEVAEGDVRARLANWARDSESIQRRRAMLAGAEAEPELVVTTEDLDSDPNLLVVRNGTLDLSTGELRESRREELCTRLAEVTHDPTATYQRWLGHVELLCNGDPVLMAYIRRAVGYTLTGDVGARSFFFMEGSGSNGKNAFIEPVMQLMGSYAQTATTALLTGGDEQHPTIMADLLGARLVFIDETRQGKALNVERVKALTGSKRVKARRMKKDFFEFDAQFKLWIAGNGQPTVRDPSDGVWNRMHRILCHGKIQPGQAIDRFGDLLYLEEASGILNWALQGLLDWRQLGSLGVPASIRDDVKTYRDEEDFTGQFIEDTFTRTGDPNDFIDNTELYAAYERWCEQHGVRGFDKLNMIRLSRELTGHGLDRPKNAVNVGGVKVRGFRGVRWASGTAAWAANFGS